MTDSLTFSELWSLRRPRLRASTRRRLSRFARVARPLPALLVAAGLLRALTLPESPVPKTRDMSLALTEVLRAHALRAEPRDIHWLGAESMGSSFGFEQPEALLLASTTEEPADVYRARVRLSPEGRLLSITDLYNLTETSAVGERQLVVSGNMAAWAIGDDDRYYSVHLADLSGEVIPDEPAWTRLKRLQRRLSNLQATGQLAGVGRRSFKLDPIASRLVIGFGNSELLLEADAQQIRIPLNDEAEREPLRFAVEQPHHLARPGNLITWAVDRVRATPWFGKDRMQWVKAIGFAGLDYLERFVGSVTGSDGSEEIAEELGELAKVKPVKYTDPETGWPPPPMKPLLKVPLEGEGQWVSLENDPYIKKNPGAPSPFMFSFIRTDHERSFSQTYVVLWDPRQVELHAQSGTQEPKTATGETGDGLVPRELGVVDRLLAGFNGGFQATHGEFGMMAEGVVYLPPKPYSATVAKLDDGFTGFGTWPDDETVPDNVVSFRQNMTPLIEDGKVNPYKRSWWGGTPPGWEDESRTIRSALCMTKEKFAAYIYGSSLDAEHLIKAARAARCDYAIHLDMNPGHTGLEFYHVAPTGQLPPPEGKLNGQWQARGSVPGMPGWEYMGRRMIKYMALMNFPRYINRESRDFFYLTLRHVLPGPSIPSHLGGAEGWRTKGLPQHGWPLAIATAQLTPDAKRPDTQVQLVKLDARMLVPGSAIRHRGQAKGQPSHDTTVITLRPQKREASSRALWWSDTGFAIAAPNDAKFAAKQTRGRALPIGFGYSQSEAAGRVVIAGAGIDAGRMVVYLEIMTGHERATDARLISSVLSELGCSDVIFFEHSLSPAIGGARTLDGRAAPVPTSDAIRLVRGSAPSTRRIFEDTPVVHPDVWAPLQRKRVRYFRKPKAETGAGIESSAEPSSAGPVADSAASGSE